LANVGIDVSIETSHYSPQTTTDADGHYEVSGAGGAPGDLTGNLKVIAEKAGYNQPCRAPIASATNGVLDIYLVSDETLSTTGMPSTMPILQPTLSGLVFERTSEGARPIPAAFLVGNFNGDGWAPSATTRSDATGRYMLCGVSGRYGFVLLALSSGYARVEMLVDVGRTSSFDIELKRQ
jgi:hypothetical protein